jgi:anti-sigma-K factor RskA
MTDDINANHRDCEANAAAYALGALETDEAQAFAHHMTACVVCRDEVAAFQGIVDALPLAAAQMRPPQRLRRRLSSSVRLEPKAASASTERMRGRGRMRWSRARPALAAAAALALAAGAIAAIVLRSNGPSGTHPHTRVIRASVTTPTASAVLRVSGGRAELILKRFPAPPAGKVYEVWLQRNGQPPTPTDALFSVTSAGSGAVDVPGELRGIDQVLVTPEPLGGSSRPTHAPVIVAPVG